MNDLHCVLCKKQAAKDRKIVAVTAEGGVCGKCITLLCDIMAETDDEWRRRQIKSLMKRGSGSV